MIFGYTEKSEQESILSKEQQLLCTLNSHQATHFIHQSKTSHFHIKSKIIFKFFGCFFGIRSQSYCNLKGSGLIRIGYLFISNKFLIKMKSHTKEVPLIVLNHNTNKAVDIQLVIICDIVGSFEYGVPIFEFLATWILQP